MIKDRNALLAGLFMLVCAGLIVSTIVGIKGAARLTEPSDERTVRFALSDNVGGLRSGDDVRVGGLKVGVVKELKYDLPRGGTPAVIVWFTLPSRIDLHKGAHIQIESTVTGSANLNIDDLGSGEVMAVGHTLDGSPSQLNALLAAAGKAAPEITGMIGDVRTKTVPRVNDTLDTFRGTGANATDLLKAVREKVQPISDRVMLVLDNAKGAMENLKNFLGDGAGGDFKGTLANLNTATGSFKEKLPGILDKVDTALAKAQNTVDGINTSLEDIKKVAANTRDITASGRSVIVDNRGKLDSMIASLKTTGDNLKTPARKSATAPGDCSTSPARARSRT